MSGMKSYRKNKIPEKHGLRFELFIDAIEKKCLENDKEPGERKSAQDIADFKTFQLLDLKTNKLQLYDYQKVETELLPRLNLKSPNGGARSRMTFAELVGFVFDNKLLDKLIQYNIEKTNELPKLMYRSGPRCQGL
jgi:hypothetical protein